MALVDGQVLHALEPVRNPLVRLAHDRVLARLNLPHIDFDRSLDGDAKVSAAPYEQPVRQHVDARCYLCSVRVVMRRHSRLPAQPRSEPVAVRCQALKHMTSRSVRSSTR